MRKGTRVLAALVLAVLMLTVAVAAYSGDTVTYSNPASGTCGENLTWTLKDGTLAVSGTGPIADCTTITQPWAAVRSGIRSVVVEEGVTAIGAYAFKDCRALEGVTIPDSVTSIGEYAFGQCFALKNVTIGNGVKTIGENAFRSCSKLEYVKMGNGVTEIDAYAFYWCDKLQFLTLSDSLVTIGDHAFERCRALKTLTLPDTVTTLGDSAFHTCDGLEYLKLNSGLTTIGANGINYCYGLDFIEIPASVTSIGEGALGNCFSLCDVYFEGTEAAWKAAGGDSVHLDAAVVIHFGEKAPEMRYEYNPFSDVKKNQGYYNAVQWANERGVTTGYSDGTFRPAGAVTRGQAVTFLWRAMGRPEPKTTVNPFADVSETSSFYKAILWAVEQGITAGYDDGTFRPNAACTEGHVLTFLWRALGKPAPAYYGVWSSANPGRSFTAPVAWAESTGLVLWNGEGYTPYEECPRAQVVWYLHQCLGQT